MNFSFLLDLGILLLVGYALIKKILGYLNLRRYEKEGAVIYRYQTTMHKVMRILCLVSGALFGLLYIYQLAVGKLTFSMNTSALILFIVYFGILPTTTGYWALTRKGIFTYLYDQFIPWTELITIGMEQKKGDPAKAPYFLTLVVKKGKSDFFKQSHYRCIVPLEDKEHVEDFINTERKKVDKIRLRNKKSSYYEEVKNQKKY